MGVGGTWEEGGVGGPRQDGGGGVDAASAAAAAGGDGSNGGGEGSRGLLPAAATQIKRICRKETHAVNECMSSKKSR